MQILTSDGAVVHATPRRRRASVVAAASTASAAAAIVVAVAAFTDRPPLWATALVISSFAAAGWAAAVDVTERRLPDALVAAVASAAIVVVVVEAAGGRAGPATSAVLAGAGLAAGPLLVVHLVDPRALGFGDVKFAVALGSVIGLADWRWSIVALFVGSGLAAGVGLVGRRREVALGPGLLIGALLAFAGAGLAGGRLLPWR